MTRGPSSESAARHCPPSEALTRWSRGRRLAPVCRNCELSSMDVEHFWVKQVSEVLHPGLDFTSRFWFFLHPGLDFFYIPVLISHPSLDFFYIPVLISQPGFDFFYIPVLISHPNLDFFTSQSWFHIPVLIFFPVLILHPYLDLKRGGAVVVVVA